MRFMMMVKHAELSGPPPQALMDAMAKLHEEAVKAGTIRGSGGLAPLAQSTRVRLSGGQIKRNIGRAGRARRKFGRSSGRKIFPVRGHRSQRRSRLHNSGRSGLH